MPLAVSNYIDLVDVVNDWSDQSGELPLLTLRRICDWAICGRFPDRTFLLPNGQQIDHLDLHRAMRIELGVHAPISRDEAAKLLGSAIVSKAGIQSFCEDLGVQPPPEMQPRKSKLLRFLAKPEHLGPPDCPAAALVADRLEARDLAIGALSILGALIIQVWRDPNHAIAEREIHEWSIRCDDAQSKTEASDDPHLRQQLADLKREWKSLTAPEKIEDEAASQPPQPSELPKRRSIGRPRGSGSYEVEDTELAREMRADILSGKHTSIAAAARERVSRAGGGGTEASKEKRLCNRYASLYPD